MHAAAARGDVVDLDAEEPRPFRLRTLRQLEEAAVERAQVLQRAADAAEEALTIDEMVAEAEAKKRATKRATRRVLRRLQQ